MVKEVILLISYSFLSGVQSCTAGVALPGSVYSASPLFDGLPEGRLTQHVVGTIRCSASSTKVSRDLVKVLKI